MPCFLSFAQSAGSGVSGSFGYSSIVLLRNVRALGCLVVLATHPMLRSACFVFGFVGCLVALVTHQQWLGFLFVDHVEAAWVRPFTVWKCPISHVC